MDLAVGRPVYAFDASREEHRAMPAYEKPPVLLGDDYFPTFYSITLVSHGDSKDESKVGRSVF